MSRLHCQFLIALTAIVLVHFSSRPAGAQVVVDPSMPHEHGSLWNDFISGVKYDRMNQAHAVRKLKHLEAKLSNDADLGASHKTEHVVSRINELKYRIAVDEWLIRQNSLLDPGFYPMRTDAVSMAAIAAAARPSEDPATSPNAPSQAAMNSSSANSVTIINAEPIGSDVDFAIDGIVQHSDGGSRRKLDVTPNSYITYDSGGSLGKRKYLLSPRGRYEFRSTPEGWALYKLPEESPSYRP